MENQKCMLPYQLFVANNKSKYDSILCTPVPTFVLDKHITQPDLTARGMLNSDMHPINAEGGTKVELGIIFWGLVKKVL